MYGKHNPVGMVGVTPDRGFSSVAHMPALQALPEFEVVAVCTTRQETAEVAAKHYGFPLTLTCSATDGCGHLLF
jgi:predicted dehydrogenase